MKVPALPRWDIFCHIIDNYGDIGICWRLARQLTQEYGVSVRIWVDRPEVAKRMIPDLETSLLSQIIENVEICHWSQNFPRVQTADVVIEAFACELPSSYLAAMTEKPLRSPVWINLEYLSAEKWVAGFHLQRSPHPVLPLTKYFFFPGFTEATGGLLREKSLPVTRQVFQQSNQLQSDFLDKYGITDKADLRVSLFCYADAPVRDLLEAMVCSEQSILCMVPESIALPAIAQYFALESVKAGDNLCKGNLTLKLLPLLSQEDYDRLLWICDLNFVRGEDSWIRALWAAKPFIWQPYRQVEETHLTKLHAFLDGYCADLSLDVEAVLRAVHFDWSRDHLPQTDFSRLLQHLPALRKHANAQTSRLASQPDLAAQLTTFCENRI